MALQGGRDLALAALKHLQTEASGDARVALIHNPKNMQQEISVLGRAVLAGSRLQSRRLKIGPFLITMLEDSSGELSLLSIATQMLQIWLWA